MVTMQQFRQQFPMFQQAETSDLIYFDNAATTQKPQAVIDSMVEFYTRHNANVHRASHGIAQQTTALFEEARQQVARFINASASEEIVWTKGCTDSLNMLSTILSTEISPHHSNVVVTALEHHANYVPWQQLCKSLGLEFRVMPVNMQGELQLDAGLEMIDSGTLLVSVSHVSNALGIINPIEAVIAKCRQLAVYSIVDGAQAVAHLEVDVQALDCDFYVFSGHKLYGPTGIGVLYGKKHLLEGLPPAQFGGEMVRKVSQQHTEFNQLPFKFEAGTPNIQGVLGLSAAIQFLSDYPHATRVQHEQLLFKQARQLLSAIPGCRLFGNEEHSIANISFVIDGVDCQDLGALLTEQGVAVRVGHHCTMPLMTSLGVSATIRISLAGYNTKDEVMRFISLLETGVGMLTASVNNTSQKQAFVEVNRHKALPLAEAISKVKGWDQRYRQIMLAAKSLPELAPEQRSSNTEIFGCETQVWLSCHFSGEPNPNLTDKDDRHLSRVSINAFASGKIIRGLLAVLLEPLQGQTIEVILAFDYWQHFKELGLAGHLSESRGNGIKAVHDAMVRQLQDYLNLA